MLYGLIKVVLQESKFKRKKPLRIFGHPQILRGSCSVTLNITAPYISIPVMRNNMDNIIPVTVPKARKSTVTLQYFVFILSSSSASKRCGGILLSIFTNFFYATTNELNHSQACHQLHRMVTIRPNYLDFVLGTRTPLPLMMLSRLLGFERRSSRTEGVAFRMRSRWIYLFEIKILRKS